ncbi:MAG: hypothetical protein K6E92_00045 [Lachnospiraceae bacterium]|nr:hypothetical protein [Lachnospiraceae bacterium]
MQTILTSLKVNNEFELCEVYSQECKDRIEQGLLQERISYFMHYPKPKLFSRHKYVCVFCVNENSLDAAAEIVHEICENDNYEVKFLERPNPTSYL